MKNSSAFTALTFVGAAVSAVPSAPAIAPGPTCKGGNSGSKSHGNNDKSDGFVLVRRSRRHAGKVAKKEAPEEQSFPPLPNLRGAGNQELMESAIGFVDPFGLSQISPQDNLVMWARTKQSVRQRTAGSAEARIFVGRGRVSQRKLAMKAAGPKKAKPATISRVSPLSDNDGWATHSDGSHSGDEGVCGSPARPISPITAPATVMLPVPADVPGRFNGRVHQTPADGSCGAHALWEALKHLAETRCVQLVLPDSAEELREVLVDDIRENLDVVNDEFPISLRTSITEEYLLQVSVYGSRQQLHNPDLVATTGDSGILVQTVDDYLAIMAMPHTHLDEFMLAAAARIWQVRVAVLERHGKRVTTDHMQFVPRRRVGELRTVFIARRGWHFEWAHANSSPCADGRCAVINRRVSAQHTPFHACSSMDAVSLRVPIVEPPPRQFPSGSRPSAGDETVLKVLVDQLCEEYPDLSPDRASAALRLTKQNGRFNLYAAARVLPGREGAPIVLHSPDTNSGASEKQTNVGGSTAGDASSTWIDAGSETSNVSGDWDGPGSEGDKELRAGTVDKHFTSSRSSGAAAATHYHPTPAAARAAAHTCGQREHHQRESEVAGANAGMDPLSLVQGSLVDQAIQFASHTISLTAKRSIEEARATLCKQMALCGDLTVAAQRACRELMDGTPVDAAPAQSDLPTGGGLRLVERQFGAEGRTPSVCAIAKRNRANDEREGPHQRHLFDDALAMQMRNAGGGLTAEQRLTTGIRRTEQHLFREAQTAERTTARRLQQQLDEADDGGDGSTPASAALVPGNAQTIRGATQQGAAPAPKAPRAAFHASPSVRVAQQMQLKRELAASGGGTTGAILVVNSAGSKLPTWKAGAEADGRGFNWKTKQRMVHAWEAYQMSEGLHAPKSFKSMIDTDLIPLICAECNLDEGDWEVLDDVTLLIAIEDKLKPHDAMDFTVQLKLVPFDHNAQKGSLTQRYRLFAEAFLSKVSEAKAAGFVLPENVIKLAFTRALNGNALLQGWLEQEKWVSVAVAHRRITNSLKMVDAYHTLQSMSGDQAVQSPVQQPQHGAPQQPVQPQNVQQPAQQQHAQQQQGFQQQVQQILPQAGAPQQFRRNNRFDARLNLAIQQALAGYQQAVIQQQNQAPAAALPPATAGSVNVGFQAGQERKPLQLPPFPGLDARGLHWHVHSAALGCKTFPCNVPFCQACGVHHHSANECRKRFYNNPGANHSGYWSEQRPGGAPLRNQTPPTANAAVQFGAPPFPIPYSLNGNRPSQTVAPGGAAPAHQAAPAHHAMPAHQAASPQQGHVNNYAAQQQPPPQNDGGSHEGKSL